MLLSYLFQVMILSAEQSMDMSPLLPVIIKLLAHSDLLIKKTAYNFLCTQSGCQSEHMILAVNTLLKDFTESNPMVRGIALKTICSVQHETFHEHRLTCVSKGLGDKSAYVRRIAVTLCVSVLNFAHGNFVESGLVDKLYTLIRDPDPLVVVNCLLVLEEVLKDEGGIVLNKNMVFYLLNRIDSFTAWGIGYTLRVLKKYIPKTEDEIFDVMNVLDSYLQHNNSTVCIRTLELFLSLTGELPHLKTEIFKRCIDSFLSALSSGNAEMMAVVLEYLEKHIDMVSDSFKEHYRSFFCRHKDPPHLKKLKIQFLTELISEVNRTEILDEITMNCSEKASSVSLCALEALGCVMTKYPEMSPSCLKIFQKLLASDTEHLVSNTLCILATLDIEKLDFETLTAQLHVISNTIKDEKGKCSILCLLGKFCGDIPESTYILEDFVDNFQFETSLNVKSQLLITAMQLFSEKPAEIQGVLGELLELAMNDASPDLNDQAAFYYSLLSSDVTILKDLFTKIS